MKPEDVLKELRRELNMRRSVYPRWVAEGKLSQSTADHRIEAIERSIELIDQAYPRPEQQSLFDLEGVA